MKITKEQLIIGTANCTRNPKSIYIVPREEFVWAVYYKPLNLIFNEFTSENAAKHYIKEFISDVKFSYCLEFVIEEFQIEYRD